MKRGGGGNSEHGESKRRKIDGQDAIQNKNKKKNMQRLGGKGGLSLESFANAKTRSDKYNPALIKKQREFYKNAKCVSKYKRSIKQQEQQNVRSTSLEVSKYKRSIKQQEQQNVHSTSSEGDDETKKDNSYAKEQNKKSKKNARSLEELYKRKQAEEEKARMKREAMVQSKKEEIQQAEARRRALKEKMYKKTRSGQPVMKYRIEHLLETLGGSTS